MVYPAKHSHIKKKDQGKKTPETVTSKSPEIQAPPEQLDISLLSMGSVISLQKIIGNQSIQRVLANQALPVKQHAPSNTIQRAETGLRRGFSINKFARLAKTFYSTNGAKPIADLITHLENTVNVALKSADVPPVKIINGAAGANGEFDFTVWSIALNKGTAFPGATNVSDISEAKMSDVADTIYHEARHGEQWYRMARMRAGEALQGDTTVSKQKKVANDVATEMGIPANIALKAAKKPLYESYSAKRTGKEDKMMTESKAWYNSVYGTNSDYRELVLGAFDTDSNSMKSKTSDMWNAIPNNFGTLPQVQKDAILVTYRGHRNQAVTIKGRLEGYRDGQIATEITRINGLSDEAKTTVEETMLLHLTAMKTAIDQIEAKWPPNTKDKIAEIYGHADTLATECYQAYKDLPEEADAWPTGGAVATKYGQL
jgi:hypothetical protein